MQNLPTPPLITNRCIQPGGVWFEVLKQEIYGRWYYYAECFESGRLFHATAAMTTPKEVRAYCEKMYPGANEYKDERRQL